MITKKKASRLETNRHQRLWLVVSQVVLSLDVSCNVLKRAIKGKLLGQTEPEGQTRKRRRMPK